MAMFVRLSVRVAQTFCPRLVLAFRVMQSSAYLCVCVPSRSLTLKAINSVNAENVTDDEFLAY